LTTASLASASAAGRRRIPERKSRVTHGFPQTRMFCPGGNPGSLDVLLHVGPVLRICGDTACQYDYDGYNESGGQSVHKTSRQSEIHRDIERSSYTRFHGRSFRGCNDNS
jgi:hypothetical protein